MKHKLLYVMDPLCGWCFGFSPVVLRIRDEYRDVFDVAVVPGGMMTGTRVGPVSNISDYILTAYKRVEDLAGVRFGEPYLDLLREGTDLLDSEPPCRAIHTFQLLQPHLGLDFAHELQLKQLHEGKSFNDPNTYRDLANQFSIDADQFMSHMESEEARYGTRGDFQWVQAAGITGFPCLVLQKGDENFLIGRGFEPYHGVAETLERALK